MLTVVPALAYLLHGVVAQTSSTVSQPAISTAVASPSASLGATLPSQAPLPPQQAWCPSKVFCAGPLLQTLNLAALYPDPKTIVDKPTSKSSNEVLADFNNITSSGNVTEGQVVDFVNADFRGEGLELEALAFTKFNPDPAFLKNVSDPVLKAWSKTVHGYWTQLIRGTNSSALCNGASCESSLIPLNHTFVVPGGRFREQYYWDSFWIIEGLVESELYDIANATLQNFMDELERFGFIPNGGRIYYLNRSQPPLFIQMLSRYVAASKDTAILKRALPLAERELKWWKDNRTLNVTSPFTNKTYAMAHFTVNNSAPRPESYLVDYLTANGPDITTPLNESQRSDLYAELASGAETGWDYTARWLTTIASGNEGLRTLNVRSIIPVCLNSILYRNHIDLADLYSSSNRSAVTTHRAAAAAIRQGILDLFWDSSKLAFYDFNIKSNARNSIFSAATFYPLWSGIVPTEILGSRDKAFGVFSSLNLVLNRYNGTYPSTFIDSGLQWDAPNAWPPHQYIALKALQALPSNVTSGPLPVPSSNQSTFSLIPSGQLGLTEDQLPGQPVRVEGGENRNASTSGPGADFNKLNGTVVNGGNATEGEGWAKALERQLANRYMTSAFCSWRATGGSIAGVVPRLSDLELNVTQSINNTGNMFEKFSNLDIDSAGRGGEYTVQAGFGWTNGVALWIASNYGKVVVAPHCPNLLEAPGCSQSGGSSQTGCPAPTGDDSLSDGALRTGGDLQGGRIAGAAALVIVNILVYLVF